MAAFNKNFVVKNGIEVGNGLIFGNNVSGRVGLGTTNPTTDIDLFGTTSVDDLIISGSVSAGSTIGKSNQYLRSTGTGVTWTDFPSLRTGFTTTALGNQTSFSSSEFSYTPGLVDVYVNGTRLRGNGLSDISEFTATNGTSIVLQNPCFGGETVDIFGYSGISGGAEQFNGVTVSEEGSIVGLAQGVQLIDFVGTSVTAVGSGIAVTVYVTPGGSGGGGVTYWSQTASGIHTLSNVGIGTTNPTSALTVVGNVNVSGISTFNNLSYFNNTATFTTGATGGDGIILPTTQRVRWGSLGELSINSTGTYLGVSHNYIDATNGNIYIRNNKTTIRNSETTSEKIIAEFDGTTFNSEYVKLYYGGNQKFETVGTGVTVYGITQTQGLSVSGVSTFVGNVGIGTTNPTDTLTVCGGDISVGINTSQGLILTSPNGTRYRLIVADDGTLSTVAV